MTQEENKGGAVTSFHLIDGDTYRVGMCGIVSGLGNPGNPLDGSDSPGPRRPMTTDYRAQRIESAAKAAYCWTHPSSSWDNVKESIKSLYLEESKAALAAADSVQCARSNELNPDMPMQELLLHMGELTAGEIRTARAAIRWANSQCAKGCGDTPILDERLESVIRTLVNGISVQSLEAKHGNLCEALEKLKKYRTQKGD